MHPASGLLYTTVHALESEPPEIASENEGTFWDRILFCPIFNNVSVCLFLRYLCSFSPKSFSRSSNEPNNWIAPECAVALCIRCLVDSISICFFVFYSANEYRYLIPACSLFIVKLSFSDLLHRPVYFVEYDLMFKMYHSKLKVK